MRTYKLIPKNKENPIDFIIGHEVILEKRIEYNIYNFDDKSKVLIHETQKKETLSYILVDIITLKDVTSNKDPLNQNLDLINHVKCIDGFY